MHSSQNPAAELFATVVANGCCIGCGACAVFDPGIRIKLDDYGRYVATRQGGDSPANPAAARVCPFADGVPDENKLASEIFGQNGSFEPHVGHHVATYAGWVVESDFRAQGSSGGLASWLLVELLERGGSEEHTSELQSPCNLVCRLLLEKTQRIIRLSTRGTSPEAPLSPGAAQ